MEKSGEDGEDIHIHDSRVYAGEGMEYYSYFTKYSQKYDLGNESSHGKSMEAEEIYLCLKGIERYVKKVFEFILTLCQNGIVKEIDTVSEYFFREGFI